MRLCDYQALAEETAIYPGANDPKSMEGLTYVTMGLVGEAGELANKVKKIIRDDHGVISDRHRGELADEISDVLWYVAQMATQIGRDLDWIADRNLKKLADRQERGVLQGSGDDR